MKEKLKDLGLRKSLLKAKHALKSTAIFCMLAIIVQVLTPSELLAQTVATHKVTGKVTAASDNSPIPGASVKIKGSTTGSITNVDGVFTLDVADGDILVVSFIGFNSEEVSVAGKTTVDIKLIEDITRLDEVVVVGYGTSKRSDLTGAVASVSEGELKKTVASSLDQALQGRAAGVTVTQNEGGPGGSVSVRIRGINTIGGNNEPLYVIDGVFVDGYSGSKSGNALSMINPADIVSMEILKDASATAIYGSRASNGVVIITTRHGESGKMRFNYDAYYATQTIPTRLETMNLREYAKFYNERAVIRGFDTQEKYNDPSVLGDGTNWQNELFRSAPMQSHQLSLSGGNEKTTYSLSVGYFTQDGIAVGSNFNRYNVRLKLDNNTKTWLKLGTSLMLGRTKQTVTTTDNGLINSALNQTPDVPVKQLDGSWGGPEPNIYGAYTTNPIAEALARENYNTGTQIISNFYAELIPVKGLVIRNEIGGTVGYGNSYYYQPSMVMGQYNILSSGSRSSSTSFYWILKNYITYNKRLADKHDFTLMAGHEAQENNYDGLSGSRTGYVSNDLHEFPGADALTAQNNSYKGSSSQESYFGRFNYSFADRYLLTATYRADASSNFGPRNKWGYFPSLAVAWRINKESFLSNVQQISNLKLRLGYGEVGGSNIPGGAYLSTLNSSQSGLGVGQLPANIPNPFIKWEATKAYNAGIDIGLFNNRIEFIVDAYKKTTDDLLLNITLPGYAGTSGQGALAAPVVNIGSLENRGLEFTLNTVNIESKGFSWKSGFIISVNRNKLLKLNNSGQPLYGYMDNATNNGTIIFSQSDIGLPIGQFYGYKVTGMFNKESDFYKKDPSGNVLMDGSGNPVKIAIPDGKGVYSIKPANVWVGDLIYKDVNQDGTIDEKDRQYLGNPEPKFEFSISNSLSYKGFDLSIFLAGVYGNKIYNATRQNYSNPNSNLGMLKAVTNYARIGYLDNDPTNQALSNVYIINAGTTVPRIETTGVNQNTRLSSLFVEDGSYLRIKNIILGYNLPKALISKLKIDGFRVYMNVQNLYTFTNYTGYDPEVGSRRQNVLLSAIDQGRYPSPRIWTFGINVSF